MINYIHTLDKQGWFTYGRLCGLSVCLTNKKIQKQNKQQKMKKKKIEEKNHHDDKKWEK